MFAFSLIIKLLRFLIYFAGFSESRCLDLAFCIFLVIDSLLLFACPKSNQKRPPKTKQPVFGRGFSIKLCYFCGELQRNLDCLSPTGFKSTNISMNRHEKQMLKSQ